MTSFPSVEDLININLDLMLSKPINFKEYMRAIFDELGEKKGSFYITPLDLPDKYRIHVTNTRNRVSMQIPINLPVKRNLVKKIAEMGETKIKMKKPLVLESGISPFQQNGKRERYWTGDYKYYNMPHSLVKGVTLGKRVRSLYLLAASYDRVIDDLKIKPPFFRSIIGNGYANKMAEKVFLAIGEKHHFSEVLETVKSEMNRNRSKATFRLKDDIACQLKTDDGWQYYTVDFTNLRAQHIVDIEKLFNKNIISYHFLQNCNDIQIKGIVKPKELEISSENLETLCGLLI